MSADKWGRLVCVCEKVLCLCVFVCDSVAERQMWVNKKNRVYSNINERKRISGQFSEHQNIKITVYSHQKHESTYSSTCHHDLQVPSYKVRAKKRNWISWSAFSYCDHLKLLSKSFWNDQHHMYVSSQNKFTCQFKSSKNCNSVCQESFPQWTLGGSTMVQKPFE